MAFSKFYALSRPYSWGPLVPFAQVNFEVGRCMRGGERQAIICEYREAVQTECKMKSDPRIRRCSSCQSPPTYSYRLRRIAYRFLAIVQQLQHVMQFSVNTFPILLLALMYEVRLRALTIGPHIRAHVIVRQDKQVRYVGDSLARSPAPQFCMQ